MKLKYFLFCFLFILFFSKITYANNSNGVKVTVSIESYDKTIASGEVYAFTFKDAIARLGSLKYIEIIFNQTGSLSSIYSVNSIKNNTFSSYDGWYAYIERGGTILKPQGYMSQKLETNDHLVLYYGHTNTTKIPSSFTLSVANETLTFNLKSNNIQWLEKEGNWVKSETEDTLNDVNIHIYLPNGNKKVVKTNKSGNATVSVNNLGVYKYYAEKYVQENTPEMVRTKDYYYFHGIKNPDKVTRGEAVAFLINYINPSISGEFEYFDDVMPSNPYFEEINLARQSSLIFGYGDNSFKSYNNISLLEFTVMLSNIVKDDTLPQESIRHIDGVPSWAQERVSNVISLDILKDIALSWDSPVTEEILKQIYFNLSLKK